MIDDHTVALVTGANRGVGACFVQALLARGAAKVYATARGAPAAPSETHDGRIVWLRLDVTDASQIQQAAHFASDVTLLINNAGINRQSNLLSPTQIQDARAEMEVNYFGTLEMARAFGAGLITSKGAMINMLSILARVSLPAMVSLCASKAAALRLTEGLGAELSPHGVRVIGVMPGAIDTEMSRGYPGEKLTPAQVVDAALDALAGTAREVYVGQMARDVAGALAHQREDIQAQLLGLPRAAAIT